MEISPHGFVASVALFLTVPIAFILFSTMKPARAAAWMAIGGAFYLPEAASIRFPMLPTFAKANLPYVGILLAFGLLSSKKFWKAKPGLGPELYAILGVAAVVITVFTNRDPLTYGIWNPATYPGLNLKDGFSLSLNLLFRWGLAILAGRMLFRTREDLYVLCKVFLTNALVYSLLVLVEARLSPQMHIWVYGYFPHSTFIQALRWGGYRPNVFMVHGLNLAISLLAVVLVAAGAYRGKFEKLPYGIPIQLAFIYLCGILVIMKSTGVIIYGLLLIPMMVWSRPKTVVRTAQVLALLVLIYPALRGLSLVPVDQILEYAKMLSEERAVSLAFRFDNEGILLKHAQERIIWGWGGYGRNFVFDLYDGTKTATTVDGTWILLLGLTGLVGMFAWLLPAVVCVVRGGQLALKIRDPMDQALLMGMLLGSGIALFDLIPNSMANPLRLFFAGAAFSVATTIVKEQGMVGVRAPAKKGRKRKKKKSRHDIPVPPMAPPPVWGGMQSPPPIHSIQDQDALFGTPAPQPRPPVDPSATYDPHDAPTMMGELDSDATEETSAADRKDDREID